MAVDYSSYGTKLPARKIMRKILRKPKTKRKIEGASDDTLKMRMMSICRVDLRKLTKLL